MLCPKCGFYSAADDSICPECGKILSSISKETGNSIESMRQGKRAREEAGKQRNQPVKDIPGKKRNGTAKAEAMPVVRDTRQDSAGRRMQGKEDRPDTEPSFERRKRYIYDEAADEKTAGRYAALFATGEKPHRMVNWMKITLVAMLIFTVAAAGCWFFITGTEAGQRLLARLGQDASSVALWQVGDERMNSGDIEGAIECFKKARGKDEAAGVVDVDGLLTLGSALEAADRTEEAAELYEQIYLSTPSRTEAYVNHIRILQNSGKKGDLAKAAELMKLAYESTGEKTFMTQRDDLLPAPPEVKPLAGYYETKKTLVFTSYQGYDVYYTFDDNAVLPYDGKKAPAEGVLLDKEGVYNMRAVAVSGEEGDELVSDELKGIYKIIMPSPQTPRATLAPNTYKTSQTVRLKPGEDDMNDASIVIYYTVDGSVPDSDSPIFNGDPIRLPNGWVTLQAYAVNRYNKLSNKLEIRYKIEANPKPKTAFDSEDTIDKLKIAKTSQQEFFVTYGEGSPAGTIQKEGFDTECRRFDYPWGYAIMNLSNKTWVLVEVSFHTGGVFTGPRETQIGDTEEYVVGKFKDMLQVESKSGNRGLYSLNEGDESGKIWVQDKNEKIIRYRYSVDTHWVQLEYLLSASGTVKNINLQYIP